MAFSPESLIAGDGNSVSSSTSSEMGDEYTTTNRRENRFSNKFDFSSTKRGGFHVNKSNNTALYVVAVAVAYFLLKGR